MSLENCKIVGTAVNPADYHRIYHQRGAISFPLSSSSLREFGHCPQRWIRGYESPDSEAKDYGNLLDCFVLTPGEFDKRYALRPSTYTNAKGEEKPWHGSATACKEWKAKTEAAGLIPLKRTRRAEDDDASEEAALTLEGVNEAKQRLMADNYISRYIEASQTQVLVQGQWRDEKTGLVIPLQCLIDLVPGQDSEFGASAGDLKSTRSAHPAIWPRYSLQRGYHVQAAFNLDMLNAAENGGTFEPKAADEFDPRPHRAAWLFILSENYFPYQPARALLSERKLAVGRAVYRGLLEKYAQCLASGVWPDYQDTPRITADGCFLDDISDRDAENQLLRLEGAPVDDAPPADEPETESELTP